MFLLNIITYVILVVFLGVSEAFAVRVEGFPDLCASASNTAAMDGHVLRLGMVRPNQPSGFVFVFPDHPKAAQEQKSLQAVPIADNAGVIGQSGPLAISPTPKGSFLVAQIFVGGDRPNPVVTCLSNPIPTASYNPSQYSPSYSDVPDLYLGQDFSVWLPMDQFIYWLGLDTFVTWNWSSSWGEIFQKIGPRWQQRQADGKGHDAAGKAPLTTGATGTGQQQGYKQTGTHAGIQGTFGPEQSGSAGAASRQHPVSRPSSSSYTGSKNRRPQR
jgi:hypothetical protein